MEAAGAVPSSFLYQGPVLTGFPRNWCHIPLYQLVACSSPQKRRPRRNPTLRCRRSQRSIRPPGRLRFLRIIARCRPTRLAASLVQGTPTISRGLRTTVRTSRALSRFPLLKRVTASPVSFPSFAPAGVTYASRPLMTTPAIFASTGPSIFGLHTEEAGLTAVNTHLGGAIKVWWVLSPHDTLAVEDKFRSTMFPPASNGQALTTHRAACLDRPSHDERNWGALGCGQMYIQHQRTHASSLITSLCRLRHLRMWPDVNTLLTQGFKPRLALQDAGSTILVHGRSAHWGANTGTNAAWSISLWGSGPLDAGCWCRTANPYATSSSMLRTL